MNTNTKTKATTAYPLVICGVFAAVMTVCSWIAIPLPSGVPINLAVLGVLLSAGCLGFKYGTLTQLVYVLLGCVGLPVFAGFNGGLHVIAGPTGRYIVGYILCAWHRRFHRLPHQVLLGAGRCHDPRRSCLLRFWYTLVCTPDGHHLRRRPRAMRHPVPAVRRDKNRTRSPARAETAAHESDQAVAPATFAI